MGRIASSSKKKYSKRKGSKLSSEAQRRKKSRRNKSKKLRHRDYSDSSYSDDDSISSVSVSSSSSEDNYLSSSEDEYKSKKGRSRAHGDAKSRRKKSRRSSSMESMEDSTRVKKRKRSKRDVNSRSRKKYRKIKRRRDCSTCQSGGSKSIKETEPEKCSRRSRESMKRDPSKARNKTGNSRSRSPSCSPHSRYSHHSCSVSPGLEKIAPETKSVRLRSVISVVQHDSDLKTEKDPYKEEIFYDRDDYPSSRSNDSNEGVSRKESVYVSNDVSDNGRQIQDATGEEVSLPNLGTQKEPMKDGIDSSGRQAASGSFRLKPTITENKNETEISGKVASSGDDDLELILRQKALENLRRFRGERQMNSKTTTSQENKKEASINQLSAAKLGDVCGKSMKLDACNEHYPAIDIESSSTRSNPMMARDLAPHSEVKRDIRDVVKTGQDPEVSNQNDIHQPASGNSKKDESTSVCPVKKKPESGMSASRQETLRTGSAVKQATTVQAPSDSDLLTIKIPLSEASLASSSLTANISNNQATGVGVVNTSNSTGKEPSNSCAEPPSVKHSSKEQQDEPKDGSQFEQKTMSVMRGGEMVEVSYKVYIPKKAPALARRQLKR